MKNIITQLVGFVGTFVSLAVLAWVILVALKDAPSSKGIPLTVAERAAQREEQAAQWEQRDAQRRQKKERELYLCHVLAACKKIHSITTRLCHGCKSQNLPAHKNGG